MPGSGRESKRRSGWSWLTPDRYEVDRCQGNGHGRSMLRDDTDRTGSSVLESAVVLMRSTRNQGERQSERGE
jgi:hypothetical protein